MRSVCYDNTPCVWRALMDKYLNDVRLRYIFQCVTDHGYRFIKTEKTVCWFIFCFFLLYTPGHLDRGTCPGVYFIIMTIVRFLVKERNHIGYLNTVVFSILRFDRR